jgi:hypothetical protein
MNTHKKDKDDKERPKEANITPTGQVPRLKAINGITSLDLDNA